MILRRRLGRIMGDLREDELEPERLFPTRVFRYSSCVNMREYC